MLGAAKQEFKNTEKRLLQSSYFERDLDKSFVAQRKQTACVVLKKDGMSCTQNIAKLEESDYKPKERKHVKGELSINLIKIGLNCVSI